jgi:hypothetical protein
MEDDLNFCVKGRQPQFVSSKEDDLIKVIQPKQLKVKTLIFLIMGDDLNFFEKGGRPQFLRQMEDNLNKIMQQQKNN